MRYSLKVLLLTILFFSPQKVFAEKLYYNPPLLIPHTERAMKTPGFWISLHPSPDKIVLTSKEITGFNQRTQDELGLIKDVSNVAAFMSGPELRTNLKKTLDDLKAKDLYSGAKKVDESFYQKINKEMNMGAIRQELKPQIGFIVHFADQRFLPTSQGLYQEPDDSYFDELQNSDLDAGEPVMILHESLDGKWCYVQSAISFGWVKKEKVAVGEMAQVRDFLLKDSFAVVIKPKADIFLNPQLTQYYDYVRMGMKFSVTSFNEETVQILLPFRNENGALAFRSGFLKRKDMNIGYLSYTPRHIIEQAFELLNSPYGWGGINGEQDCSRFLQEVFATVGIYLPRDSKNQAKIGHLVREFKDKANDDQKLKVLQNEAIGGITILPLKGHIMLFLGFTKDRPYVIHAAWAYTEKKGDQEFVRATNRVMISDLSLSQHTKKRSLLERLISIVNISK